jgi:hypothetical protein
MDAPHSAELLALKLGTIAADSVLPADGECIVIVVHEQRVGFSSTLPEETAHALLAKVVASRAK